MKVLGSLARYFGTPTEVVLRLAGYLPPAAGDDDLTAEANAEIEEIRRIVMNLPPDMQDDVTRRLVDIAQTIIRLNGAGNGSDTSAA